MQIVRIKNENNQKRMNKILYLALTLLFVINIEAQKIDFTKLKNLKIRNIGPAGMSGRIVAIDASPVNSNVIYIGAASGGLWKSESGGLTWQPIFDKEKVQAIGSIKVDRNNPDVIWVGTGEGNPRNSHNSGNGIYRSSDAGKSWKNMGLENTLNIHRVLVDRRNSDIVYAGVIGSAWSDSEERGVFKTTNSGETWQKILFVDSKTGCADLVQDPQNSNKLFASMWEFRREPWFFKSGGKSSGLFVTYDGGKTWKKLGKEEGLPVGDYGRIGVAIAPSNPNVVYAMIETASENSLYKSNDGGAKFTKVNDKQVGDRPFYYSEIFVHPKNENTVIYNHTLVTKSIDGGKTFETFIPWAIHPDHHAFWVDENNPNYMINGNDGGAAITQDGGATWRFIENLPVGQFYHVNVDNDFPYNVYGGLQDNGSWKGPSTILSRGGIKNHHWKEVFFGDGFDVIPDPDTSRYVYAMWQGGNIYRIDTEIGQNWNIKPVHPNGEPLRFNWNTAIAQSPQDNSTIYCGSQYLHKSTNKGIDWKIISPDLTTNDSTKQNQLKSGGLTFDVTSAENHTTIIAISPSKLDKEVLWVGTDDGNVQLTTDGGDSWKNTADMIYKSKNSPKKCAWVPQITASRYNKQEAFIVMNDYRRGDRNPYLMHTVDNGNTWSNLVEDKGIFGFVHSFIQDPVEPRLMFLGTEYGLYVSIDAGENWTKWSENFPSCPVTDIVIQERDNHLVIGTFGRALWVMDDLVIFRELAKDKELLSKEFKVIPPSKNYVFNYASEEGSHFAGHGEYRGESGSYFGKVHIFSNKKAQEMANPKKDDTLKTIKKSIDTLTTHIYDLEGNYLFRQKTKIDSGYTAFAVFLCKAGVRGPSRKSTKKTFKEKEEYGYGLAPGKYKLVFEYGNLKDSTEIENIWDPRVNIDKSTFNKYIKFNEEIAKLTNKITLMCDKLSDAKEVLDGLTPLHEQLPDSLKEQANKLVQKMQDSIANYQKRIFGEESKKGITDNPPTILIERYYAMTGYANNLSETGNYAKYAFDACEKSYEDTNRELTKFFEISWRNFRDEYSKYKQDPFDRVK